MDDYLLQMMWDTDLVCAWRANVQRMFILENRFCNAHKITEDELRKLRRTTRGKRQIFLPVRAFVAQALPHLSNMLWDGKVSDADAILKLAGSRMDTGLYAHSSKHSLAAELRANERSARRIRSVDIHHGHRRSDWSVCKT